MNVGGRHYRTVWLEKNTVKMIDQSVLPHEFSIIGLHSHAETATAIRDMKIRGAGAIGSAAGYAMAQAALEAPESGFMEYARKAKAAIERARPTAQNLFYATNRVFSVIGSATDHNAARKRAVIQANAIADEDAESCRQIGLNGSKLIHDGYKIGTHCNAGWLAFTDWGSALSPIYQAAREGKRVFVYVDETRPRGQGASLTAWELLNERVKHEIIADNAAGFLMQRKEIDMFIVGADRVCAADGSAANKIGTYEKAVVAKENGIPFYVAMPASTIDWDCKRGSDIPIEKRGQEEVLHAWGVNDQGVFERVRVAPKGSTAFNPAFDITPGRYITAFITEKGIFRPRDLRKPRQKPGRQ